MKKTTILFFLLTLVSFTYAQSPVGKWKTISYVSTYGGQTFDSQKDMLKKWPCASKFYWEINADGTYRQNTSASDCDKSFKKIQEKLYSKTNWKVVGNKITISSQKNASVGQTFIFTVSGNKMILVGTESQGTITYQKL